MKRTGFTLAEVLIALALLGVVAAFAIPKILNNTASSSQRRQALVVVGMITNAYQQARMDGIVNASTKPSDLMPYMNYISRDTSSVVDWVPNIPDNPSVTCSTLIPCVRLHGGGMLIFGDRSPNNLALTWSFGGTTANHAIPFLFDPDTTFSGSAADGPSKAVQFVLYYDGSIRSRGTVKPNTLTSNGLAPVMPEWEPSWFHW